MSRAKKILVEGVAAIMTLALAGVIITLLFTRNITPDDTFKGTVEKTSANITSPVYGQIETVPVQEGDTIHKGEVLATIRIMSISSVPVSIPVNKALYRVNGVQMSILSPAEGIVGQIAQSPLSTINSEGLIMQIDMQSSFFIALLMPQGYAVNDYAAFSVARPSDRHRYALHIIQQIPTDAINNFDPTMSVYRATCTNCQTIFDNESVTIYAQHKQPTSPIIDTMRSLLKKI